MALDLNWLDAVYTTIKNYNEKKNEGVDPAGLAVHLVPLMPRNTELREYVGFLEVMNRVEMRNGKLWAIIKEDKKVEPTHFED